MWIKPQAFNKTALWTVVEKNDYFELLKVRTLGAKFVDYTFKIILKGLGFCQSECNLKENHLLLSQWIPLWRALRKIGIGFKENYSIRIIRLQKKDSRKMICSFFSSVSSKGIEFCINFLTFTLSLTVDHPEEKGEETIQREKELKHLEESTQSFRKTFEHLKDERVLAGL